MKHINEILKESLLDDDLETKVDKTLIGKWIEKYVTGSYKYVALKNGTFKFRGEVIIKGFDGTTFPEGLNISFFQGDLKIEKCPNLVTLAGLFKEYTDIDGDYSVSNCPKLVSVAGGPMAVKGNLQFVGNSSLKTLDGMPGWVYKTIYMMKNGKKFTAKDIEKYVQVPNRIVCSTESEDEIIEEGVVNEAMIEPHLLELNKQLKQDKEVGVTFKNIFSELNIQLDQLDSTNVKEYDKIDDKALKAARAIISKTDARGFILLKNHEDKYTSIITHGKRVLRLTKPKYSWTTNSWDQYDYSTCISLINDSASAVIFSYKGELNTFGLKSRRLNARNGMIHNTPEQNQKIARENIERYKTIIAQNKAKRDSDSEKIDTEVQALVMKVFEINSKAKRDPEKYATYEVATINDMISDRQFTEYKGSKTYRYGQYGLLYYYKHFTSMYMDVVRDGGMNYDRNNLERMKKSIFELIDKIKDYISLKGW